MYWIEHQLEQCWLYCTYTMCILLNLYNTIRLILLQHHIIPFSFKYTFVKTFLQNTQICDVRNKLNKHENCSFIFITANWILDISILGKNKRKVLKLSELCKIYNKLLLFGKDSFLKRVSTNIIGIQHYTRKSQ